jgi:hypothetical protein
MNTVTASFDTLLTEMSLALDLAAELEGELKTASLAVPASRTSGMARAAQTAPALLGFGQAQGAA